MVMSFWHGFATLPNQNIESIICRMECGQFCGVGRALGTKGSTRQRPAWQPLSAGLRIFPESIGRRFFICLYACVSCGSQHIPESMT